MLLDEGYMQKWTSARRCSIVECSSVVCSFCAVAAAVPPRPQDSTKLYNTKFVKRHVAVASEALFQSSYTLQSTIVPSCVTD